jgi:hypothetical protein
MRVKTLLLVGLVLWAWSGVPVIAQQELTALQLVPKNNIGRLVVEGFSEGARSCGITESLLDAAVRLPINHNGFRINPTRFQDFLYVKVTGIELRDAAFNRPIGTCAIAIKLGFHRDLRLISGFNDNTL